MGYDLAIRPKTPDAPLDGPALSVRLSEAARTGLTAAEPGLRASPGAINQPAQPVALPEPGASAFTTNAPASEPGTAAFKPNRPWEPGTPASDTNRPAPETGASAFGTNSPTAEPGGSAFETNTPATRSGASAFDTNSPASEPGAPAFKRNAPATEPGEAAFGSGSQPGPGTAADAPSPPGGAAFVASSPWIPSGTVDSVSTTLPGEEAFGSGPPLEPVLAGIGTAARPEPGRAAFITATAQPEPCPRPQDSTGPWMLTNGRAVVQARLYLRDEQVRGADLEVAFGGTEEELRRLVEFALDTAESIGAVLFDPQLGRELLRSSADEVVARWRESQSWMVDVAGTYEDTRGLVDSQPHPPLVTPRNKFLLMLAGGAVLLYVILGAIADLFSGS